MFVPPDQVQRLSFKGFTLRTDGCDDADEYVDSAIRRLPAEHNLVEAVAALVAAASEAIGDFETSLLRFAELAVICSSPSGRATIGKIKFVRYVPASAARGRQTTQDKDVRSYPDSGIHQDRKAFGSAVMMLGMAFREGGMRYSSWRQAYIAALKTTGARASGQSNRDKVG
ncbi:hypothetical protein [Bradyrhizobium sp. HKCCYLR1023]|uniref:hypothetical protein n=1 Tax=Bradyrhizobium TaxID=374 RepID=UPI003EBF2F4A